MKLSRPLSDEDDECDDDRNDSEVSAMSPGKKKCGSQQEQKLVELIRHKKQLSAKKAKIILTAATANTATAESSSSAPPTQFFVQDLQRILLYSVIGTQFRFFPRWCKILRPNRIKSTNLIVVSNFSERDYQLNQKHFRKLTKLFTNAQNNVLSSFEFVSAASNGSTFFKELVAVPIARTQWLRIRDQKEFLAKQAAVVEQYTHVYGQIKNKEAKSAKSCASSQSELDAIPRTSLLLSVAQLSREDYPLPFDRSGMHEFAAYVATQDVYAPVSDRSPLFAMDCEMCYNEDGDMEVVWVAIVNERLECIYESFVKPQKRIRNYLTQITGVSKETLENVRVTLRDVQAKIREILPADAILCGQSLNNDLHALQMFHPYIIDTSIIYNLSGSRDIKPSLRQLAAQFLGKLIQEGTHHPAVDAKASLNLVLLKLRRSLDFGDMIINGCLSSGGAEDACYLDAGESIEQFDLGDPVVSARFIYKTGLNISQDFFNVLRDNNISNVFIDHKAKREASAATCKQARFYEDHADALRLFKSSLDNCQFTWTQLYLSSNSEQKIDKHELKDVIRFVRDAYASLHEDSLLVVVFTDREKGVVVQDDDVDNEDNDLSRLNMGRCFLKLKCDEMELLEEEVKTLYSLVKNI